MDALNNSLVDPSQIMAESKKRARDTVIMESTIDKGSFFKSSKCKLMLIWMITGAILGAIYVFTPSDEEKAIEGSFIVSTVVASLAATSSILIYYASPDKFNCQAYLVHGTTFMFSFFMLGLLATDLAFTLKHRHEEEL